MFFKKHVKVQPQVLPRKFCMNEVLSIFSLVDSLIFFFNQKEQQESVLSFQTIHVAQGVTEIFF